MYVQGFNGKHEDNKERNGKHEKEPNGTSRAENTVSERKSTFQQIRYCGEKNSEIEDLEIKYT